MQSEQFEDHKKYLSFFPFNSFNQIQIACFDKVTKSSESLLISAPTSSGKTVLFELAFLKLFGVSLDRKENAVGVYICPIKSLCQEKVIEWTSRYKGLRFVEMTSDSDIFSDKGNQFISGIIITTPEKFNLVLRKWIEFRETIKAIELVMVDEIHLLGEKSRGAVLESLLTRLKLLKQMIEFQQSNLNRLRFLAVSATIGNIQEVASWLGVEPEGTLIFGEAERPVPLEIMVLGYMPKSNPFLFDLSLNYKLLDLIRKFGNSKPILIFCSTQKSAMSTANEISRSCEPGEFIRTEMNLQSLVKISSQVQNQNLKACILHGVGFHHAALSPLDRGLAESSFRNLLTPILCTTSTLALGMNLPAYLVIIKGTYGYRKGAGFEEMTTSEIKQMGGRAGRKGFESHGLVIVMTEKNKVDFWRHELSNESQGPKLESTFATLWEENLNNEIALRTVKTLTDAEKFFKCSFEFAMLKTHPKIDEITRKKVKAGIDYLLELECIEESNGFLTPTPIGFEFARQCISVKALPNFISLIPDSIATLLEITLQCSEIEQFDSRQSDRKPLKELNSLVPFPIKKGSISTSDRKAFVLLQAKLSLIQINNWELKQQAYDISIIAIRLLYTYRRVCVEKNRFIALGMTIRLLKALHRGVWEQINFAELYQIEGMKQIYAEALANQGLQTLRSIADKLAAVQVVERIVKKDMLSKRIVALANCAPIYSVFVKDKSLVVAITNPCPHPEHGKTWIILNDQSSGYFFFKCMYRSNHVSINIEHAKLETLNGVVISDYFLNCEVTSQKMKKILSSKQDEIIPDDVSTIAIIPNSVKPKKKVTEKGEEPTPPTTVKKESKSIEELNDFLLTIKPVQKEKEKKILPEAFMMKPINFLDILKKKSGF